jgi:hypothetical protein
LEHESSPGSRRHVRTCLVPLPVLFTAPLARTQLLASAISGQGVLAVNGEPADGVYDLQQTP